MNINATGTFSKEDGTLTVDLEFHPATEIEHEIVAEFIRHPVRTAIFPTKLVVKDGVPTRVTTSELEGDLIHVRLELDNENAFDAAVHNLENRKRAAEGRPSLEQEAERTAMTQQAQIDADAENKAASAKAEQERNDTRDRIERLAAKEIADRVTAPPAAAAPVASEPSKEEQKPQAKPPDKVQ